SSLLTSPSSSLASSSPAQKSGDSMLEIRIVLFGTVDLRTLSSAHFAVTRRHTPKHDNQPGESRSSNLQNQILISSQISIHDQI
ncbi:hypothetical protein U1Q18_012168, partial [Sarracenia purpurea var. burkii]